MIDFKERKRVKNWHKSKYEDSIDYALSLKLKEYNLNIDDVIVWKANLVDNIILFQYQQKYYQLKANKVKEIASEEIWPIKKTRN